MMWMADLTLKNKKCFLYCCDFNPYLIKASNEILTRRKSHLICQIEIENTLLIPNGKQTHSHAH